MAIFLQNVDLLGIRRLMVFAKNMSTQRVCFPFCRLKGRRLKEHWSVRQMHVHVSIKQANSKLVRPKG